MSEWRQYFETQEYGGRLRGRIAPEIQHEDDRDAVRFFKDVFAHHYDIDPRAPNWALSSKFPPEAEKLTSIFHNTYFEPPQINEGLDRMDPTVGWNAFLSRLLEANPARIRSDFPDVGACNCNVIIGEVGIGKTTLFTQLMRKFPKDHDKKNYWFLHFDVERFGKSIGEENFIDSGKLDLVKAKFLTSLRIQMENVIRTNFEKDERDYCEALFLECSPGKRPVEDPLNAQAYEQAWIRFFVGGIANDPGRRLVLCLDNSDLLYYIYDRASFFKEGTEYRKRACIALKEILSLFLHGGGLYQIGASVIIILRKHTYLYLASDDLHDASPIPGSPFTKTDRVFRIEPPTPEIVIESRRNLYNFTLESIRKLKPTKITKIEQAEGDGIELFHLIQDLHSSPKFGRVVDDIAALCNHGYRDLVDHLSNFYWGHKNINVTGRWFEQYSPAIISYMNDMNVIYTQGEKNFPNMFLIRNDTGNEQGTMFSLPDVASKPHRQTYWLKYLIASYIHQNNNKRKRTDIFDVFCGTKTPDDEDGCMEGFYETHIVQLCLGSLGEVRASNVIEPNFEDLPGSQNPNLRMTKRGQKLLDEFVWSFTYLQLVVDDPLLQVPNVIFDNFQTVELDYRYLANLEDSDYSTNTKRMVSRKLRKVSLFLTMLEITLHVEKIRYPETFSRLDNIDSPTVYPKFDSIRDGIFSEFMTIMRRSKDAEESDAETHVEELEAATEFANNLKAELQRFFDHIYLTVDV